MNQPISFTPPGDAARQFLSRSRFGHIIDGLEIFAASGQTFETTDPSRGIGLAHLAAGGDVDIERAVRAARTAFEGAMERVDAV
jgi:aldehyde dehydrogenase (NAD+)